MTDRSSFEISSAGAALLERVEAILPQLRTAALEEESMRRLKPETLALLSEAGVLRMHVPERFGGANLGLKEHFQVCRLLAHAAASTAWVASFLSHGAFWARKYSPEVQQRVFDDPDFRGICGSNQAHAGAKAVAVDGGYRLTGRWGFTSGIHHASWLTLSMPLETERGSSTRLFVIMPAKDVEIIDVWKTSGMCATGSNDVAVNDYFLPADQGLLASAFVGADSPGVLADPTDLLARCPVYRIAMVAHTAFALGLGEQAVEVFRDTVMSKRQRYWGGGPLKEAPVAQMRFAQAAVDVRTAVLLGEDMVQRTVDGLRDGYSMEERAYLTLSSAACIDAAGRAVQALARMSGGSMHFKGHPMDLLLRDMNVLLNHSTGDLDYAEESCGAVMLGQGLGKRIEVFF